jgi:hypothetical protein
VRTTHRWFAFWFEASPAGDLGVSRLLFFGGLLVIYLNVDVSAWGTVSHAFWRPTAFFAALHLEPLTAASLDILQTIWRISLMCSAIGLFTRVSMTVAALLGFYLLGLPHNFGHTYHFDALLVISMAILAMSRAGDAVSIDRWRTGAPEPSPSGEYTWPIRMIWVAMSLVFFAAAVAKLRHSGLEWITSNNMKVILTRAVYHVSDADPLTNFGLWIAAHDWLTHLLAAVALIIELGFIVSLVSPVARIIFVPAAFALLVGIRVLMGPTFGGFLIANVFWVPWSSAWARAKSWLGLRSAAGPTDTPVGTFGTLVDQLDPGDLMPLDGSGAIAPNDYRSRLRRTHRLLLRSRR